MSISEYATQAGEERKRQPRTSKKPPYTIFRRKGEVLNEIPKKKKRHWVEGDKVRRRSGN